MGYVSKDIAIITEPKILSLAGVPNYVQFESKPNVKTVIEVNIQVKATPDIPVVRTILEIASESEVRTFKGTTDVSEVGSNVFYISTNPSDTAENLRQALISDSWINSNFEVVIPFNWISDNPVNGDTINIRGKASGADYLITITAPNNVSNSAYVITWVNNTSTNNDSISGEASTAEIQLDVYTDPDVFYGADDRPVNRAKIGHYVTTLTKTYSGSPLWFDLNALFSQYISFTRPPEVTGWFNPGTSKVFRFFAKVKDVNSFSFYQSNALYLLCGYSRLSDNINLEDYAYSRSTVKLLTNKPRTTYVRGQKEYLNFILKDDQRESPNPIDFAVNVLFRAYSTAGDFLGTLTRCQIPRLALALVNTCVLNIDEVLDNYPNAGVVKACLVRNGAIISNDLEYEIRPDCLHKLQQFSFINKLGGWDAFNAGAVVTDEIKPEYTTYNKTATPGFKKGDSIETIYAVTLDNPQLIEGALVTDEVAEWLKELAGAKVVIDNEGYYVIFDDFDLKPSPASKNMQTLKLKYHLSETLNND